MADSQAVNQLPADAAPTALPADALPVSSLPADAIPVGAHEQASVMGFLKHVASSAGRFGGDVASSILHPGQTLEGVTGLLQGMAEKSGVAPGANGVSHAPYVDGLVDLYKKRYGSWDAIKNSLYTDPVGVAADLATLADGAGMVAKGVSLGADAAKLGRAASIAGKVADTAGVVGDALNPLKAAGSATMMLADVSGVTSRLPQYLYRTALRAGYRVDKPIAEVQELARTGLAAGIPVSQAGVSKIYDSLQDLNKAVTDKVADAAAGGLTIDRNAVSSRLVPVDKFFANQVAPEADLKDITRVKDQWVRNNSAQIPADQAQAIKVGTYQQLQSKYGKLSDAEVEAQKALARGIKEELATAIPELNNLNEKEGRLLDLQGVVEKAVNKSYNHNGGIGPWLTGGAATAITRDPKIGLAVGIMRDVLADPNLRSRLAIALNKAQAAHPVLGKTASFANAVSRIDAYRDSLNQQ